MAKVHLAEINPEVAHVEGVSGAESDDAGEMLASALIASMRQTGVPSGLEAVGYAEADITPLVDGAIVQQRLLGNAPRAVSRAELGDVFRGALRYW